MAFELCDETLRVRLMTTSDAFSVFSCRNLPEVSRYQGWRPTLAEVERVARDQARATPGLDRICQLVIEDNRDFVGDFGVVPTEPGRQAELGIVLHPSAQGRGLATCACRLLIGHLFAVGLHRITARVDPRNVPSLRLFDRLGLRREGHEVECFYDDVHDEWTDEICFAVLAREWARRIQPPQLR